MMHCLVAKRNISAVSHSPLLCFTLVCLVGEDPLAGDQNDHDMDSIAGVLKLYFRGLENALFPKEVFHDLMSCVCECVLHPLHHLNLGITVLIRSHDFGDFHAQTSCLIGVVDQRNHKLYLYMYIL